MYFSISLFSKILFKNKKFNLSKNQILKIKNSENFLQKQIENGRVIYGINTGYGPLADTRIPKSKQKELQKNLIYHLASGVDKPFSEIVSRAILLTRIICLAQGFSGINLDNLQKMILVFNANLVPYIPSLGTVGASGDLTPLSHLALSLMGEGYFIVGNKKIKSQSILGKHNIKKIELGLKDGLSIVNGTSVMTAISILNSIHANKALELSIQLSLMYAEIMEAKEEIFSMKHSQIKLHPGIFEVLKKINQYKKGSTRFHKNKYTISKDEKITKEEIIQDAYSIRCIPQILGAVYDFIKFHDQVVEKELNSVSDNPIIFEDEILHGGNFQGTHIALASDSLLNSIINLAILSERSIARITDSSLNKGLPAFLQKKENGLHSGFMGAQVTSTAILSYMKSIATPSSIQSISTNANNQDVVSMGTIAANKTNECIEKLFLILSIQGLCLAQAMEIRKEQNPKTKFSISSEKLFLFIRKYSASLESDRPLSEDIETLAREFLEV